MYSDARKPRPRKSRHNGSIEVNTLIIWVILLVFLALALLVALAVHNKGEGILGGLCLGWC